MEDTLPPLKGDNTVKSELSSKLLQLLHPRAPNADQLRQQYDRKNRDKGMIYRIKNSLTGGTYIGATTSSIGSRFKSHRKHAARRESPLARDMLIIGRENFSIEHIATALHIDYLAELETVIILQERPTYNRAKPRREVSWRNR